MPDASPPCTSYVAVIELVADGHQASSVADCVCLGPVVRLVLGTDGDGFDKNRASKFELVSLP